MKRILVTGLMASVLCVWGWARASVIDFDTQTSLCCSSSSTQGLSIVVGGYKVVFTGGGLLSHTANLPADQTGVYGTASFGYQNSNPLTISFFDAVTLAPKSVSNFYLDILNGNIVNADYTLADELGHLVTVGLAPNLSLGSATIGFASAGSVITLFATPAMNGISWDFFIDNIHFDARSTSAVPEPGTLALLGIAIIGFAVQRRFVHRR